MHTAYVYTKSCREETDIFSSLLDITVTVITVFPFCSLFFPLFLTLPVTMHTLSMFVCVFRCGRVCGEREGRGVAGAGAVAAKDEYSELEAARRTHRERYGWQNCPFRAFPNYCVKL